MNITQDKIKVFLLFSLFSLALVVSQHLLNNLIFNNGPKNVALNNGLDKTLERERVFQLFLSDSSTQLTSIRDNQIFKNALIQAKSRDTVAELFEFVAKNNPYVMQVRYLDEAGQELVRIERKHYQTEPQTLSQEHLQNEAAEAFFKDARHQTTEQVLFSTLDLNIENGQIEIPFKPTLSAYLPVFEADQFRGVLLISYFMEPFLKHLIDAPLYDVILADAEGNILYHYDPLKSWSAYRGVSNALSQDCSGINDFMNQTVFKHEDYVTRNLNLPIKNELYLILKLKQPYFEALASEARHRTFIVALITLIFALFASLIMARQLDKIWRNLHTSRALEKQFRDTFEQAASGMAHIDISGQWIRINQTLTKMLGYTPAELAATTLHDLRHLEDRNLALELKQQLLDDQIPFYQIENRLKHQQGHYVWVSITISLVRNAAHKPDYFILVVQDINQEKQLNADLNQANETLKIAQQTAHLGFWELRHTDQKLTWNTQTFEIFGLSPSTEVPNLSTLLNLIPEEEHKEMNRVFDLSVQQKRDYHFSHSIITSAQQKRYLQERGHHIFDAQGQLIKTIGTVQDQTEQVKAYQRIQKIFDLQNQLLFLTDGVKITLANQALLSFFGQRSLERFIKNEQNLLTKLTPFLDSSDTFSLPDWMKSQALTALPLPPITLKNNHGKTHTFNLSVHEFDEKQWLITLSDISKTMQEKELLETKVNQDALTKAYTRHFFDNHIDQLIEQAHTNQKRLGIIYLDIDHFKQVNDTFGHDMGDNVLTSIVTICKGNLREKDYVVRWGGEEFLILIQIDSEKTLSQVTENLRRKIANHEFDTQTQITASFGITLHSPGLTIQQSLTRADEALYKAKNNGRNQVFLSKTVEKPITF